MCSLYSTICQTRVNQAIVAEKYRSTRWRLSTPELKNELSSVVNSTVSNLKRNRTEAMLDKELLKRRSHKRTTYPGQMKIGGSNSVYNDVGDKVRTTKVKTV